MATSPLASIPAKRYFTIGEVGELCDVKPHVLRYWEQEFSQLRPMKRRGNRRYYQHHEVLMIRRIRDLLYDEGFTISGARGKLQEWVHTERAASAIAKTSGAVPGCPMPSGHQEAHGAGDAYSEVSTDAPFLTVRQELIEIRQLLQISD